MLFAVVYFCSLLFTAHSSGQEGFKSASVLGTKLSPLESYRMIFSAANASGATHVLLLESYAHLLNPDALTHLLLEVRQIA